MEMKNFKNNRNCNGCTKCCDGWLIGNIYGHDMYIGKPCHFVKSDGCSIYNERPHEPCKIFKCEWLVNLDIPEWLYPKKSEVIILKKKINNIPYFEVIETGKKLSVEILNWILFKFSKDQINMVYYINGGKNWLGSKEFDESIRRKNIS
jgi:hypothetical protein